MTTKQEVHDLARPMRIEFRPWSVIRALGIVGLTIVVLIALRAANTILVWLAVATVLAALFYPPLVLFRRFLPNWLAIVTLVFAVMGLAGFISYRGFAELQNQVDGVRSSALAAAQSIQSSQTYGNVATEFGLATKVGDFFSSVPIASSGDKDLGAAVGTAASSGSAIFAVVTLGLMMLLFGQRFLRAGLEQVEQPKRRRKLRQLITRAYDGSARYAWMMAARAAVIGLVTSGVAAVTGVGSPTVVGLWFAALSVVPALGIVLATLPLAALTTSSSPTTAAALVVGAVIVQAFDAVWVMARIEASSVRVGPLPTVLALLLGFQIYGPGGALVFLAVIIFVMATLTLLLADHEDLPSAVQALADHQDDPAPLTGESVEAAALAGVRVERHGDLTRVVDLGVRTPVFVAITIALTAVIAGIMMSGPTVALTALAVLFAFAVDPLVGRIERRLHVRRGFAVSMVCGAAAIAAFGGVLAFGPTSVDQARSFQQDVPRVIDELTTLPVVGPVLASNNAPDKVREWAAELPKRMSRDPSAITSAATTVVTGTLAGLLVFLIMISALIDGPRLVSIVERLPSRHRAPVLRRAGGLVGQSVGRYFSGSLVLAGLQAAQVLVTGLALGVPLSPLLALWAGVWNLVPQVGGAIGGLAFVLVAFTQGATTGLIAALAFAVYLVFANNVLLPVIIGKAVDISPVTTMVATIGGFAVGGIIGAMVAVPLLGAGKAIYAELRPDHFDRYRRSTRRPRLRIPRRPGARTEQLSAGGGTPIVIHTMTGKPAVGPDSGRSATDHETFVLNDDGPQDSLANGRTT